MGDTRGKRDERSTDVRNTPEQDDIELFCIPCNEDGSLLEACGYCEVCKEYLCETCFQSHRSRTQTMDHPLLDKEAMSKGHLIPLPRPVDQTEFCKKHTDRRIKYYCPQHRTLCCDTCVKLGHENCKTSSITELASTVQHSEELRALFSEIRAMESKCQLNVITARENVKKAKKNQHIVVQEIHEFKKELIKYLDQLEDEMVSQMQAIAHVYEEKLESSKHTCIRIAGKMADIEKELKQLGQKEHLNNLFVEMKKAEKRVEKLKEKAERAFETSWQVEFTFESNESLMEALKSEKIIGNILEKDERIPVDALDTFHEKDHEVDTHLHYVSANEKEIESGPALKYTRDINVKSDSDWLEPHITGIAVIPPDKLAVVDNKNEKVKIVELAENSVVSEMKLSSAPFDIAHLPNHELAITLPEEMSLQILHGTKLTPARHFQFDKHCKGVCYARDKLVVTFVAFPGEVRILNLQGEVLNVIDNACLGKRLLDLPCYVTMDEHAHHIYVSDYSKGHIIQFNGEGRVQTIFQCKKRGYPEGIVTIKNKHTCVSCSSLHYLEMFSNHNHAHAYKAFDALQRDLHYPAALATDRKRELFCSFVPKGKKWLETVSLFEIEFPDDSF